MTLLATDTFSAGTDFSTMLEFYNGNNYFSVCTELGNSRWLVRDYYSQCFIEFNYPFEEELDLR